MAAVTEPGTLLQWIEGGEFGAGEKLPLSNISTEHKLSYYLSNISTNYKLSHCKNISTEHRISYYLSNISRNYKLSHYKIF